MELGVAPRPHAGGIMPPAAAVSTVSRVALCDASFHGVASGRCALSVALSNLNTCALRESVLVRRASLPALATEKARRLLKTQDCSQNKLQELQRGVVHAALALASIIPPYALA